MHIRKALFNMDGIDYCKECQREHRPCGICRYKQTLIEIKPILEFYANSKMSEEQPDGTYKIMLSGGYVMAYDPKPARQALQKINECEVTND